MAKAKERVYSRYTKEAATLLGKHIKLGRKAQKITEKEFADRVGISRATLQKIEKGGLKSELGIVFEAAMMAGIKLFEIDSLRSFGVRMESVDDKLALLPKSVRKHAQKVDDEF